MSTANDTQHPNALDSTLRFGVSAVYLVIPTVTSMLGGAFGKFSPSTAATLTTIFAATSLATVLSAPTYGQNRAAGHEWRHATLKALKKTCQHAVNPFACGLSKSKRATAAFVLAAPLILGGATYAASHMGLSQPAPTQKTTAAAAPVH